MKPTPGKLQIKKFRGPCGDFWMSSFDGFQSIGWMFFDFRMYFGSINYLLNKKNSGATPFIIFRANPIVPFENSENQNADVSTIS
jgi:hypothetical protein